MNRSQGSRPELILDFAGSTVSVTQEADRVGKFASVMIILSGLMG